MTTREKQEDRCRFEEQKIELEQNILNIKKLIEGMNEEDFALLKKGANLIKKDQISNIWIEKSNVLIVANKLVELDAIGLLNEFENTMSINDDANNYSDDKKDLGYSKSM